MSKKLKIVYFGSSGQLSIEPFMALLKSPHEIAAVVINAVKSSRPQINVIPLDELDQVESLAFKHGVRILRFLPDRSNLIKQILALQPDIIITSCFEKKLPQEILSIPKIASLNLHPSLLPKFRGPSPIFWQLKKGVKKTGVTLHLMTAEFDAGDIVSQKSMELRSFETFGELKKELSLLAVDILIEALKNIHEYVHNAKAQDESSASYYTRFHAVTRSH